MAAVANVVPGFAPSEWDRSGQRRYAFPDQQLTLKMVRRNINIHYFTEDRRWMPVVLCYYARGRCSLEGRNVTDNYLTVAAAELTAPHLPHECFLPEAEARKTFIRAGLQGLCNLGYESMYSEGILGARPTSAIPDVATICARIPNAILPDVDTWIRVLVNIPAGAQGVPGVITGAHYTGALAEAVALLLSCLAANSSARGRSVRCNIYTLVYVSLAKKGTITQANLDSINNAVSQETNLMCDITAEEVRVCKSIMSRYIDNTNAKEVMTTLATRMGAFSLPLRLIVEQTTKSGMTSYWAIYEALRVFESFPWEEASRYIVDDFIHYQEAVAAVGNNKYYGFRADLGVAKHTRYKSLSWLAIKLLAKFHGAEYGSLTNYRGLPAHPNREVELQQLIDAYVPPAMGRY